MRIIRTVIRKLLLLACALLAIYLFFPRPNPPTPPRTTPPVIRDIKEIRARVRPRLEASLAKSGFTLGAPVFIRIFKEEHQLEVWLQKGAKFELYKTYKICNFSGDLGPKLQEGDRQAPEGFYYVNRSRLNPKSRYHLSFNLGYPNAYDRSHRRTGNFLMVHGACVSVGCYAITNKNIEEVYLMAEAALAAGQPFFRVHAFPFKMTRERISREKANPWYGFWRNLKTGYDAFETTGTPPDVSVDNGQYRFTSNE